MWKWFSCLIALPACSLLFEPASAQNPALDGGGGQDGQASLDATTTEETLELTWIRQLTGQDSIELNDIAVSTGGDVYVAGLFQESLKFDDSSTSITGGGLADIFVGRILSAGKGDWLVTPSAAGRASASLLDFQGGHLVVAGAFDASITVGATTTTAGSNDIWWANVAPSNGGLSVLRTSGGTSSDRPRGLAQLGGKPVVAATLGGQGQFFGQDFTPTGGADVFLGITVGTTDTAYQHGSAGNELVADVVARDSDLLLLVEHDSGFIAAGTLLGSPDNADGVSVLQHSGTSASTSWGVTVADLAVSGTPTMDYNGAAQRALVSGLGQGDAATIGGEMEVLAVRTGWAVALDDEGSVVARVLVRSDWTDGIAGCVMDDGRFVIASYVEGGTPAVEVNGTVSTLTVNEPALAVFVVDPSENVVTSELVFPATGAVEVRRMLCQSGGAMTLGGWINGSLTLPDGTTINAFNSGYPDSFVMRLQL